MTTCVMFCDEKPKPVMLHQGVNMIHFQSWASKTMSTNDQPDELGGTHVSGTGWMYEGPNNEINKEVF